MDTSWFDRLTRAIAATTTRRAALAVLFGWLLTAAGSLEETDARKRRRKGRPRKRGQGRRGDDDRNGGRRNGKDGPGKKKEKKQKRRRKRNRNKARRHCPDGQTRCGAACVDTSSDARNCGRCGAPCAPDQRCQNGACTCNGEQCAGCCDGGACRDGTDDLLCGLDGAVCQACSGGRVCQGGSCGCPAGRQFCAGACIDPQTDHAHCGQCDHPCAQGEICRSGHCGVVCGAGGFCAATSNQPDCCGETCTATATDASHCGACGNPCDSQITNRCVDGVCKCGSGGACAPDQHCLDGTCTCNGDLCDGCCDGGACRDGIDDLLCGTNGEECHACDGGRTCQNGECACPAGQHVCDGACVDRQTNTSHCGSCRRGCGPGEICQSGFCGVTCGASDFCLSGSSEPDCCGEICTYTESDGRNCGACGNDCSTQGGNVCFDGDCRCGFSGATCTATQTCCPGGVGDLGICRNTEDDFHHCGDCGHACGPNANRCYQGGCRCENDPPCFEGLTCCGNQACFDLQNDWRNCGACWNVCEGGSLCIAGVCQCAGGGSCPAGQTCCGDGCMDLQTDRNNCGFCSFPCQEGFACCNGRCRDLRSDINNCGACGNACPGDPESTNSDVICVQGECNITCRGAHYDLNGDPNDGCEVLDGQTNHTLESSENLGSFGCHDSQKGEFRGWILSDARPHNPAPPGYDPEMSAAPVWYTIFTGIFDPFCENDVLITLAMSGATPFCYKLTFQPFGWVHAQSVLVGENGQAILRLGQSSYSDSSFIDIKVEKICGPPETVYFEADFHL